MQKCKKKCITCSFSLKTTHRHSPSLLQTHSVCAVRGTWRALGTGALPLLRPRPCWAQSAGGRGAARELMWDVRACTPHLAALARSRARRARRRRAPPLPRPRPRWARAWGVEGGELRARSYGTCARARVTCLLVLLSSLLACDCHCHGPRLGPRSAAGVAA